MSLSAVFLSSPFDKEIRYDCDSIKLRSDKDGEVCILQNYNDCIFTISEGLIEISSGGKIIKLKILSKGVVKIEDNCFYCFSSFKEYN